jgi:hypothetical protein
MALMAALLLLGGCATPGSSAAGPDSSTAGPGPDQADVTAVHPGPDDHSLAVDLDLPGGARGCGENPRLGYHTEENGRIFANVVADSPSNDVTNGCPTRQAVSTVLTFEYVVAGKPLNLNVGQLWDPGDPDYRLCPELLGCHPPADHCDRTWIDEAISHMDVPRHSYLNTRTCDQTWLVIDINTNAGACGAGRPGCTAPPSITRWFLHFDERWREVTGTRRAGCVDVLAREPAFPPTFCENLAAPNAIQTETPAPTAT